MEFWMKSRKSSDQLKRILISQMKRKRILSNLSKLLRQIPTQILPLNTIIIRKIRKSKENVKTLPAKAKIKRSRELIVISYKRNKELVGYASSA